MTKESVKSDRILAAAKDCFLNYGFKKTSMSDIAKQADMSRPALYLHFDNKETIFREIVKQLHQQTLTEAARVLQQQQHIIERLKSAFECRTIVLFSIVHNSTHGDELTDINSKIAAQINRASMSQFIELMAEALDDAVIKREIQLIRPNMTAAEAAELLVNSAHGIKQAANSTEDFRDRLMQLIKMFEGATAIE